MCRHAKKVMSLNKPGSFFLKITALRPRFPQHCNALSDLTDWVVVKSHLILRAHYRWLSRQRETIFYVLYDLVPSCLDAPGSTPGAIGDPWCVARCAI